MSLVFSAFTPLIWALGIWEVTLIALVVLLLFGGKKIPELMRGVGKGIKSFKDGIKDVEDEVQNTINEADVTKTDSSDKETK